jgi:hypothetical protein
MQFVLNVTIVPGTIISAIAVAHGVLPQHQVKHRHRHMVSLQMPDVKQVAGLTPR